MNVNILLSTIDIMILPLSILINLCYSTGTFPDIQKNSRVAAIFKNPPVSIIPLTGKIIDITLKNRLEKCFEHYRIINKNQFGFRKNVSIMSVLCAVV